MKKIIILFIFSFIELQTKSLSSTYKSMKKDPKVQVLVAYYARKENLEKTLSKKISQDSKLNKYRNKVYALTV